jgi:hypothetical protein
VQQRKGQLENVGVISVVVKMVIGKVVVEKRFVDEMVF